jgi:hypothetical protein
MLAALVEISHDIESHLNQADQLYTRLYEGKKEGEENDIHAYQETINSSLKDLCMEMREWKIAECRYVSSSGQYHWSVLMLLRLSSMSQL